MIEAVLMSFALALDALAVSVSSGISVPGFAPRDALKLGIWFGVFQSAMPLIGWAMGEGISRHIGAAAPWIACIVLAAIGGRMVLNSLRAGSGQGETEGAPQSMAASRLATLAVATSIDALAAGLTLPALGVNPWLAIGMIGAAAFGLSVIGGLAGRRLGVLFRRRAEIIGGLTLVGIGLKTLIGSII